MKKAISILVMAIIFASCAQKEAKKEGNSSMGKKIAEANIESEPSRAKGNTALVIIDIQNDYFPGGKMELVGAEEAAEKAKKVLVYFRENNLPVVHIKHIALQEGATFFLPDTEGTEIHESVVPLKTEKVIVKNYPNSFRETEFLTYLKSHNISNLVFCGMMTDVCVDATTRAAMDLGFNNTIIGDAVTTRDRDLNGEIIPAEQVTKSYLAGLNALGGLYAKIKTSGQFLEK